MALLEIPASPFFDDLHTERLEAYGTYFHTYEFSIPSNHASAALAVPKGMVLFPDLDNDIKCFVIKSVDEESSKSGLFKRCYAEDSAQDELTCAVIAPVTYTDHTPSSLLTHLLAGTRWLPGMCQANEGVLSTVEWTDYPTVWEALLWLGETYSVEIKTRVVVEGNHITARYIDLPQTRGGYTGQVLNYGRDTESMTRSGDGGEIYTAMYGVGATVGGSYITFDTVEWTIASGDPVDKPNPQLYVEIPKARTGDTVTTGYGIPHDDGTIANRMGVFRDSSEESAAALLDKTYAYLLDHSVPQYAYEVKIAALERMPLQRPGDVQRSWEAVRVGDTVLVNDTACNPPYRDQARVIEVRRSYSDPTQDSIVLGKARKRVSDYIAEVVRMKRKQNL